MVNFNIKPVKNSCRNLHANNHDNDKAAIAAEPTSSSVVWTKRLTKSTTPYTTTTTASTTPTTPTPRKGDEAPLNI